MLFAALLAKGVVWAMTIPPLDGPDEPGHLSNAQLVAFPWTSGGQHSLGPTDISVLAQGALVGIASGSQPSARYYQERAGHGALGPLEQVANGLPAKPQDYGLSRYLPLAYIPYGAAVRAVASGGITSELWWGRLVSVLIGALAGLATVWAGRQAGLNHDLSLVAGAITGFQPMWSQQTAIVTADAPLFLWSALTLGLMLRFMRDRSRITAAAAIGCVVAGSLTKAVMLYTVPLIMPVIAYGLRKRWSAKQGMLAFLMTCAVVGVSALALSGWLAAHGGVTGVRVARYGAFLGAVSGSEGVHLRQVFNSFWGVFGWLEQGFPGMVRAALGLVTLIGICLGVVAWLRRRPLARTTLVLLVGWVGCVLAAAVAFDLIGFLTNGDLPVQGRYLLPALPALAILAVAGVRAALPAPVAWMTAPLLASGAIGLNLVALETIWSRAFIS